jgi:hypothetical protein
LLHVDDERRGAALLPLDVAEHQCARRGELERHCAALTLPDA